MTSRVKWIDIDKIVVDDRYQTREKTRQEHVKYLAQEMRLSGFLKNFPLGVHETEDGKLVLVDGFHRYHGAKLARIDKVPVKVIKGSVADALAAGVTANKFNGIEFRFPEDYKHAARLMKAAGMPRGEIANTFWPTPKEDWPREKDGYSRHPKETTVKEWLYRRSLDGRKSSRSGHLASRLARPALRAAGYPQEEEVAERVLTDHFSKKSVREDFASRVEEAVADLEQARSVEPPSWSLSPPSSGPGIPVLFISDIHKGEVVLPEEVRERNEYNSKIAAARLRHVFKKAVELLKKHLAYPEYEGIVLALGGDLITGAIHDELSKTNDMYPHEAARAVADEIAEGALGLADEFGGVYIVGVVGNHGRTSKKPVSKERVRESLDYDAMMQVQRILQDDPRFTFNIPLSADVRFDVAGRRFLLTHGDQFRGGDGMIGAIGPIMRGILKKARDAAWSGMEDDPFDTVLLGHFHQTIITPRVIVNGSLIGRTEYSETANLPMEEPSQTLFTVHPDHGLTWFMPIYATE